jgi:Rod binding domain-containing protein
MAASVIPQLSPGATAALTDHKAAKAAGPAKPAGAGGKIRETAENFEAAFINSMFQQMFENVGKGPFSGGQGANVWRSFLTDEYSKSFVKAGGIGIADEVQRALLAQQEIR